MTEELSKAIRNADRLLILVRGAPGSGKSTLAQRMLESFDGSVHSAVSVSADDFMVDDSGAYRFQPDRLPHVHNQCQRCVCQAMSDRDMKLVIVHNTFVRRWEADMYYTLAQLWGFEVKVIRCTGKYGNVHGVPESRVDAMRQNMEAYTDEYEV